MQSPVSAIYLNGTSDPSANTTAPTNNVRGCNAVGKCNGFAIVRTWTNTAIRISSHGVPAVGDIAVFDDGSYTITNVTYDPDPGVVGIRFNRNFTNNSWTKVSTNINLNGKGVQVMGYCSLQKGRQITTVLGCPSQPLILSSIACFNSSNIITVTGGDIGTHFVIRCRTNFGPWVTITTEMNMPASKCYGISTPQGGSCSGQLIQYQAMVTGLTTITNGYERFETGLGIKRHGTNTIEQGVNSDGSARYEMAWNADGGADECATGPQDSSGPGFVVNTNTGLYELSLLVESGDEGPYWDSGCIGGILYGPMTDQRGMTLGEIINNEFVGYWTWSTAGPPQPSKTQFTGVGRHYQWLKSNKFVP